MKMTHKKQGVSMSNYPHITTDLEVRGHLRSNKLES